MIHDFARAHFQIRRLIIRGVELLVGACAAHQIMQMPRIPSYVFDSQLRIPGITKFQSVDFCQVTRGELA